MIRQALALVGGVLLTTAGVAGFGTGRDVFVFMAAVVLLVVGGSLLTWAVGR